MSDSGPSVNPASGDPVYPAYRPDIVRDLDHLHETTITVDQKPFVIRSEIKGTLGKVFQAAGVAIPPAVRPA